MTGRPRADAVRNRARVLAAAEAVLAAEGPAARMDVIARRAGVGVGTVYRHFPTKEALYEAIIEARLERLLGQVDELVTADDPGGAFLTFFTRIVEKSSANGFLVDALADAGVEYKAGMADTRARMRAAVGTLLANAQRAGAVRADVGPAEVLALLLGACLAAERANWDPALREHTLAVIFDGLRRPAP